MVKIAPKLPAARVSRSGLWLIGGALLLSLAVLAWALQGDPPAAPVSSVHRPAHSAPGRAANPPAVRSAARGARARGESSVEELAVRPPSVADYGPLLQGNAFQPRVVSIRDRGVRSSAAPQHSAAARHPASASKPAGPQIADGWNDWRFTGIAELDQHTYALMDQSVRKESRFVKAGDPLENGTIVQVAENEVTLRQADGSLVRVKRVDPAADLQRLARPPAAPAPGAAPAPTTPFPSAPGFAPGGLSFPNGQPLPQAPSAAPGGTDQSFGRRGRRFQQQNGDTGGQ